MYSRRCIVDLQFPRTSIVTGGILIALAVPGTVVQPWYLAKDLRLRRAHARCSRRFC